MKKRKKERKNGQQEVIKKIKTLNLNRSTCLAVDTQHNQHEKEQNRPQLRHWKLGKGCWVGNKHQTRTWKGKI